METLILKVDRSSEGYDKLDKAARIIKEGGLVAFPTETVYGLGGDAKNPRSCKKIYRAKGRPSDNPLIVHIAEFSQLEDIVEEVPVSARELAKEFWPGPLTMILKKNKVIPRQTTGGLDTIAIRMPDDEIARELILRSECLIAAPSANVSGKPSPTIAEHVYKDLSGRIEAVIDGGQAIIGLESTIIDLTSDIPTILRPGAITKEMLERVIGRVDIDASLIGEGEDIKPKAPGMKYKHYAPKAELTIVEGNISKVVVYVNSKVIANKDRGLVTGVIASSENVTRYSAEVVKTIGSSEDEEELAHNLYSILREFDETNVSEIYSESFKGDGISKALMNRLLKAAGHKVVNADKEAITRIIFAGKNGSSRSPMAAYILKSMDATKDYEILSRGILVQFPEPLNPKVEAVLLSNGIEVGDFHAVELTDNDINSSTIIFTMEESHRDKIIGKLEKANEENTFVLPAYVGDELDILNPYGGGLQLYGLCFEALKDTLNKLVNILNQER